MPQSLCASGLEAIGIRPGGLHKVQRRAPWNPKAGVTFLDFGTATWLEWAGVSSDGHVAHCEQISAGSSNHSKEDG